MDQGFPVAQLSHEVSALMKLTVFQTLKSVIVHLNQTSSTNATYFAMWNLNKLCKLTEEIK